MRSRAAHRPEPPSRAEDLKGHTQPAVDRKALAREHYPRALGHRGPRVPLEAHHLAAREVERNAPPPAEQVERHERESSAADEARHHRRDA